MKQNKNSPVIRIGAFSLAVFVLFISMCVPSFAYSSESLNGLDFSGQPIPYSTEARDRSFLGFEYSGGWNGYIHTNVVDVSIFLFGVPSQNRVYSVSSTSSSNSVKVAWFDGDTFKGSLTGHVSTLDSPTGLYYDTLVSDYATGYYIPTFSSLADGLSAVSDWINNPPVDPPLTGEFTYSLPAGNVMFIDVTNLNVSFDLSQTTPLSYWGLGATQYAGTVSSLPSSLSVPLPGTSIINWSGSGKADAYGKYQNWVSHATVSGIASDHNHVYYVVENPLMNNSTAGSGLSVDSIANGNIVIHASNSNSVKVFQLESSFNAGVYDNDSAGDTMTGHSDGSGGLGFTNDTTGEPDAPTFGGMTTPESQTSSIQGFLQNIATQISGFFTGAIGAVSTLVSSGSDFMRSVSGLYSWLPGPVYTVLTSAIILVITIGVIKVFI